MRPNLINRLKEEWSNLDPVDPLRGLLSDAIDALAEQPAQTATYTCGVCGVSMQMEQPAQQEPVGKVNELFDEAVIEQCGFNRELLVYTSPQASKPLTPEWYAQWIRNNYQDYWNIATLCDEMTKAAHGITKGNT